MNVIGGPFDGHNWPAPIDILDVYLGDGVVGAGSRVRGLTMDVCGVVTLRIVGLLHEAGFLNDYRYKNDGDCWRFEFIERVPCTIFIGRINEPG